MLPESLIEGAATEILEEVRGWNTIEALDKIWTTRHLVKHVIDAILVLNALVVIRKGTFHGDIVGDLIDNSRGTKAEQLWLTGSRHD